MTSSDSIVRLLSLRQRPVAVAFLQDPPAGVPAWTAGPQPAGCTFWSEAASDHTFYTAQKDHYNCAVGCHTHHIPLPHDRAADLQGAIELMVKSGYLTMEEIPGIPTLKEAPRFVAYGPADGAPFVADVVIVAGTPGQMMLLNEACIRAGATSGVARTLGRPGCAALPMTLSSGEATMSFGCKGNRIFTGTPDGEMHLAVPGAKWTAAVQALETILAANRAMEQYYLDKKTRLPVVHA
jgi:uncharacterized protein (DUF169 family)